MAGRSAVEETRAWWSAGESSDDFKRFRMIVIAESLNLMIIKFFFIKAPLFKVNFRRLYR